MKATKLYYINIFLAVILGLLIILNLAVRLKNKEHQKIYWDAEIRSSTGNSISGTSNLIKIIDVGLYNNFSQFAKGIDVESNWITSAENANSVEFKTWYKELLPDSLSLNYFSIDERKFYLLKTSLPYEKIKNYSKKSNKTPLLILEIQPKGKTVLKIEENKKSKIIETYTANEIAGNLDMLVYMESLNGKNNEFEGIENINDFSELLQNQYKWLLKVEMDDDCVLKDVSGIFYSQESIEMLENNNITPCNSTPRLLYIKWGNQQEYGIQYYFNANEILNAFRVLNKMNSSEPIIMTFKLYKEHYPQCEVSKIGKTIRLNNLYPEKPIEYK
ncbi:hypothetical protein J2X31_003604 [Flavobacterium arsenatis]|uniref:Uncharacterized protein n=1 Tax=Flavobacterium arsenatis TaxID=1484332 RepID=A0ABU1TUM2_9FLAO|nr:hypothetical protein [Flavobacterium arsenatis]MDR6969571.1 hypothetical protein [Flavobacterium arsenatis]